MRLTRTLAAALIVSVAAIAAPVAQSKPHASMGQGPPADMHASVALAAAASRQEKDHRSADALDAAVCPRNNAPVAGASSQRPTAGANGLGGIVAGLFVIGGLATLYSRRGQRSQRLPANH